mmetsp:Transcript_77681/g.206277  ORF Transcript_77681/g.206277 Transcript_77681/m.206277 type:complete len:212 (+) Transcript_77681:666-1301(+)
MVQVHHPEDVLEALVVNVRSLNAGVEQLLAERAYAHVGALRDEEGMPPWRSVDLSGAIAPQASDGAYEGRLPDAALAGNQQGLPELDGQRDLLDQGAAGALHLQGRLEGQVLELQHHLGLRGVQELYVPAPVLVELLGGRRPDRGHGHHELPEPLHAQLALDLADAVPRDVGREGAGVAEEVLRGLALAQRDGADEHHGVVHAHQAQVQEV